MNFNTWWNENKKIIKNKTDKMDICLDAWGAGVKAGQVKPEVILETAENITEELFQNGFGEKAQRLVLELEDKSNGGGWGKKPVIDVIVKHIESSLSK